MLYESQSRDSVAETEVVGRRITQRYATLITRVGGAYWDLGGGHEKGKRDDVYAERCDLKQWISRNDWYSPCTVVRSSQWGSILLELDSIVKDRSRRIWGKNKIKCIPTLPPRQQQTITRKHEQTYFFFKKNHLWKN